MRRYVPIVVLAASVWALVAVYVVVLRDSPLLKPAPTAASIQEQTSDVRFLVGGNAAEAARLFKLGKITDQERARFAKGSANALQALNSADWFRKLNNLSAAERYLNDGKKMATDMKTCLDRVTSGDKQCIQEKLNANRP